MEYLKLIKEILTVLSDTPLPTIVVIVGLAFLLASLATIKLKPFEIKQRRKILGTPLSVGGVLVVVAILLYSFAPQVTSPAATLTITSTLTEPLPPTPTLQASLTALSQTPTNTPSPTVEPSPTPTATPLPPTLTPTPTSTPTPVILFQDHFLDNKNRWQLVSQPRDPKTPGIETNIYGGKFVVTVDCPAAYPAATCNVNVPVPYQAVKDFFMTFETSVVKRSKEANVIIGVQFRRTDASYYWFQYKEYGAFLFSLILKGETLPLSEETQDSSIETEIGSVNKIGVYAKGSDYVLYANGAELTRVEDGNIDRPGDVYIKFHVARNNTATIELDNLVIQDTP